MRVLAISQNHARNTQWLSMAEPSCQRIKWFNGSLQPVSKENLGDKKEVPWKCLGI